MEQAIAAASDKALAADLEQVLKDFEARCDRSDPEQLALLEAMREHTRDLKRLRGDWNVPNSRRNWNAAMPPDRVLPPKAVESFRAYKEHVEVQKQQQQLLAMKPAAEQQPEGDEW